MDIVVWGLGFLGCWFVVALVVGILAGFIIRKAGTGSFAPESLPEPEEIAGASISDMSKAA